MNESILNLGKSFRNYFVILFFILIIGCTSDPLSPRTPGQAQISVNNGPREGDKDAIEENRLVQAIFSRKHPDIRVKYSTWQYSPETFLTKMAGATCTDVIGLFATEGVGVAEQGLAEDITDRVKSWEYYADLNPVILEPFTINGRNYGMPAGPYSGYIMALFYNKRLFRQTGIVDEKGEPIPPETWDELVITAGKLTNRKKNQSGFGLCGATGVAGWYFLNWVWQAGGEFEEKRGGKWMAVYNEPPAVRALQFIRDLRWKHDVIQSNILLENEEMFKLFATDQVAMAMLVPEWIPLLVEKYGMNIEDIGVTLLPEGPGGRVNQTGGSYTIMNPMIHPEKKNAAWTFITFNHDTELFEAVTKLRKDQGRIVGFPQLSAFQGERKAVYEKILDKYRNVPRYERFANEASLYARSEPPFFCQQLYSEGLSPAVQSVLTNPKADPQKVLDEGVKLFQSRFLDKVNKK